MPLDTEFLRQHYAAMSDEELESVNRADLVDAARQIYDDEVAARVSAAPAAEEDEEVAAPAEEIAIEIPDNWLDDAAEAYSSYPQPGTTDPSEGSVDVRDALESAGIPCSLELFEEPEQEERLRYRWRVLVPGILIHRATSVIDRDIFNAEFEAQWRTHLEMLTDEDLQVMEPQYAFCGLYDRIERIEQAYQEELERRRLNP
jgi:hypothetical protein